MSKKYFKTDEQKVPQSLDDARRMGIKTVILQELNGNLITVDDVNHMSSVLMRCYEFDHMHNGTLGEQVPLFKKKWN